MDVTKDERKGCPSGSSALEDQLCWGRWRANQTWQQMTNEASPPDGEVIEESEEAAGEVSKDNPDIDRDADAGRRIHKIYGGQECPEASEPERQRAEAALHVDKDMKGKWLTTLADQEAMEVIEIRERRWWLYDKDNQPMYSGQSDVVWLRGEFGGPVDILVGDLKGLWGDHDAARSNVQLRRYIALIAANIQELGFSELRTAMAYLNQPAKTLNPVPAMFDATDIQLAMDEMYADIINIMDESARRTPGPRQCKLCRAKLICEEFLNSAEFLPAVIPMEAIVPSKETIELNVNQLPADKLEMLLDWAPALTHCVTLAKAEAKRRLRADPRSLPNWLLKPNSPRNKVCDLELLWVRLEGKYGLKSGDFIKLCGITKKNVEQAVRENSKLKGKALDSLVDSLLEGCTMPVPVQPSLDKKE